jgi:hypothetical protein
MSDDQDAGMPAYEYQVKLSGDEFLVGMSADEFREIARIHYREAEKLLERAHEAQAEDRMHEAMLLTDLSIEQRKRAEQYELAAKGECRDPIVAEILDGLQEQREGFTPVDGQFEEQPEYTPKGRFDRALSWISRRGSGSSSR